MTGAFIILLFTAAVGLILYLLDRRQSRNNSSHPHQDSNPSGEDPSNNPPLPEKTAEDTPQAPPTEAHQEKVVTDGECCGLHLVCEKELTAIANDETLYYDDEELDRFASRSPEEYSDDEIEEFRDVMMTLLPIDVPGWARSLDRRGIQPPAQLRDELIIMIREAADQPA